MWEKLAIEDCQVVDILCTGILCTGILCTDILCTGILCTDILCTDILCTGILCTDVLCTDILFMDVFDCGTIIHHKCVPKGQTFNRRFYREVLQRLRRHVRRKRPEWRWSQDWLIVHKNAPAHPVVSVRNFWPLNRWLWPSILLNKLIWPFVISQWFRE